MPNIPETVIAFLAVASIGAIWSSCSPDFGARSVIDRFKQIEPVVLLAVDGYRYNGKVYDKTTVVSQLKKELFTVKHTVLVPYIEKRIYKKIQQIPFRGLTSYWNRRNCHLKVFHSITRFGFSIHQVRRECPNRLYKGMAG